MDYRPLVSLWRICITFVGPRFTLCINFTVPGSLTKKEEVEIYQIFHSCNLTKILKSRNIANISLLMIFSQRSKYPVIWTPRLFGTLE